MRRLMKDADIDGSGKIEYADFLSIRTLKLVCGCWWRAARHARACDVQ